MSQKSEAQSVYSSGPEYLDGLLSLICHTSKEGRVFLRESVTAMWLYQNSLLDLPEVLAVALVSGNDV